MITASRQMARILGVAYILVMLVGIVLPSRVGAAELTERSLTIDTSQANTNASHKFDFKTATTADIGSIKFEFCTAATGTCTSPFNGDFEDYTPTISAQSGATGFSAIANPPIPRTYFGITRAAANVNSGTPLSYTFSSILLPSTANTTYYVRISTYTSTNLTGSAIDTGTVAASTANQITVTASVNETLTFCVYTGANCAASGSSVALGNLTTGSLTGGISKMDAATNASGGYIIQYYGPTLTSGSNTINAIGGSATTSSPGTSQFGINATGANTGVSGSVAPSGGSGVAASNYATPNQYAFVASTPTTIANSANAPSNTTTYTVSYIANISAIQQAGSYTTTITYICTATF